MGYILVEKMIAKTTVSTPLVEYLWGHPKLLRGRRTSE
jgi:hypothetical protein